jgi:carboxylesterase
MSYVHDNGPPALAEVRHRQAASRRPCRLLYRFAIGGPMVWSGTPSAVEPFSADGGPVGVLFCHGFTGSPASLRPWAQAVADAGYTVRLPRLPGHGTSVRAANRTGWPDWYDRIEREYVRLSQQCREVFVFGLSMGGCLALRLAQAHRAGRPGSVRDDDGFDVSGARPVAGLVLVNPAVVVNDRRLVALPLVRRLSESSAGIANDIAMPGENELGYTRVPHNALHSMLGMMKVVRAHLAEVTAPMLLFRSVHDHVVGPQSAALILGGITSTSVREQLLPRSFHVATLDYEADDITRGSLEFLRTHATAGQPVPAGAAVSASVGSGGSGSGGSGLGREAGP